MSVDQHQANKRGKVAKDRFLDVQLQRDPLIGYAVLELRYIWSIILSDDQSKYRRAE